jgi:putative toxin-antitoxin system antitoxin component (TIGR02293 family)
VREAPWTGEAYSSWDLPTAARRISEGLPAKALDSVQLRLDLSNEDLAHVIRISPRTLTRRKKENRLPPDESERVYRIARLLEIAARVLGNKDDAREWMKEPNYALGEEAPLEMARTQPGAELVERLLSQIEHGITV